MGAAVTMFVRVLIIELVLVSGNLQADNIWWDVCDGDWFEPNNWILRVPESGDTVYIDNGCGGPLISDDGAAAGIIYVGLDTTGNTLMQTHLVPNSLTVNELHLGEAEGSEGTYTLGDVGALTADVEYVGYSGSGTFIHHSDADHIVGSLYLGFNPGSNGTYELKGGELVLFGTLQVGWQGAGTFLQSGGTVTVGFTLYLNGERGPVGRETSIYELKGGHIEGIVDKEIIGTFGPAIFRQTGGVHNVGRNLFLGWGDPSASGHYEFEAGELTVGNDLSVGYGGSTASSTFTQSGGINTVGNKLHVGRGSDGNYELSGTGELSAAEEILGNRSTGTIVQTGGTNTITGNLTIGYEGDCHDTYHVPGIGRYELSGTGELFVGGEESIGSDSGGNPCPDSRGDFVQAGGTHTVETCLYIACNPGITGTYEMSDGELSARMLWVGYQGPGEFTQTGGAVRADRLDLGREPGSSGVYELGGSGELTVEDRLVVGRNGDAVLTLDGGVLMTETLTVGRYSGFGSLDITSPSADVTVRKELALGQDAGFGAEPGAVVYMTRDADGSSAASFHNFSQDANSLLGLNNLELSFEGGDDLTATMEIGGSDRGPQMSGFEVNFALGVLRVGTDSNTAHVMLVSDTDNGSGDAGSEVLYVDTIVVSEGSTLDVNGRHVYYIRMCKAGAIELNGGVLEEVGLAYDADRDCDVDTDDLVYFVGEWLWEGPVAGSKMDLNCDGNVDFPDYRIIASHWLDECN